MPRLTIWRVMMTTEAPHTPEHEARRWLAEIEAGDFDADQEAVFRAWLDEDDAHRQAFRKAVILWETLAASQPLMGAVAGKAAVVSAAAARPRLARWRWPSAVAAGVALLAVAMAVLRPMQAPVEEAIYASTTGRNRAVVLDDGSTVTLSGASHIRVRIDGDQRRVELVSGSAFLDVIADPARPFAVIAGAVRSTVTGTAFEVRRASDGVRVSVTKGSVRVAAPGGADAQALALEAGEQVSAGSNGVIGDKQAFDMDFALAWLDERLAYDGAPLRDVVTDANRYRRKKIEIADPAIAGLPVTISFPIDQTDRLLTALSLSDDVTVSRDWDRIRLSGAKPDALR